MQFNNIVHCMVIEREESVLARDVLRVMVYSSAKSVQEIHGGFRLALWTVDRSYK